MAKKRVDVEETKENPAAAFFRQTGAAVGKDDYNPAPEVAGTTGDGKQVDVSTDGNTHSITPDSEKDPTLQAVEQLIDLAKETDARNQAAIEAFIGKSIPELQAAANAASQGDYEALQDLKGAYSQFEELAPPEMVEAASSNAVDIERQQGAYDRQIEAADAYKPLMTEGLTAQERYEMEIARREEEGSRRAYSESVLRDLDARGARSGGAEMAALLGGQQTTSQNRALQDLGSLANAQQRRLGAIEGYAGASNMAAGTASTMRDQGDVMNRFNQQQAQQWAQWEGDFKAGQQRDATSRSKDLFDADTYTLDQAYGRQKDVYGAERDATAMKTGQYSAGAAALNDAISQGIGVQEGRRAEAALNKEDPWELGDPILLDKLGKLFDF